MLELKTTIVFGGFMWITQFRWPALFLTFLTLTACVSTTSRQTRVDMVEPVIVTPMPAAREVMVIPAGYVNCRVVPGRWHYNSWVPQHKVCHYAHNPRKVTWVQGYWTCTKYMQATCQCGNWDWHSSHWYNRSVAY